MKAVKTSILFMRALADILIFVIATGISKLLMIRQMPKKVIADFVGNLEFHDLPHPLRAGQRETGIILEEGKQVGSVLVMEGL